MTAANAILCAIALAIVATMSRLLAALEAARRFPTPLRASPRAATAFSLTGAGEASPSPASAPPRPRSRSLPRQRAPPRLFFYFRLGPTFGPGPVFRRGKPDACFHPEK